MPSEPLAYFITFRTYGSWLHGDARGSVDREHNIVGAPLVGTNPKRKGRERLHLKHPSIRLNRSARAIIRTTIETVCERREWTIHALEVRSNHVHIVVSAPNLPERVMNDLKSWGTRRLIEAGEVPPGAKAWSRHGSTKYLWKPQQFEAACKYVCDAQGDEL